MAQEPRKAPAYVPTRHELIQLVKYWYSRVLDDQWFFFTDGQTGSSEFRIEAFAGNRIARAAVAIGEEAVDQAIKEVREEFKAKLNDARLWDIFENGTDEQWKAVSDETNRKICEQFAAKDLERLEQQLEKESPGDFVAMVLCACSDDNRRPVFISPRDSQLNAVLQAGGISQVETDKSRLRTLVVDQHYTTMGFLRATRQDGGWRFEFPDSQPGTIGWLFLELVVAQIKELLQTYTMRESPPA